ncbi:HdeA/HdeB family chaperone [Rhodopseudomonas palustris]|uniref:HdeA/HdeB family chaperone n=1 Tax=Rhodopseudomonas palustris TaxID=1076 RepID=UPI002ACE96FC|nr:HdeA/HdeB family chaperone [Rhodopseudomonas palustris]WQH01811.1 HdeA/HdeB family chaperone [Rhodopseudomonas palustris]
MLKFAGVLVAAAGLLVSPAGARAEVLDLATMSCKQFIDSGPDEIKMVLTWLDGWYKGDSDDAIIDTEVFVANAKKFGAYCGANPSVSIVTAAEKILGK